MLSLLTEVFCWLVSSKYRKAVRDDRKATKALIEEVRRIAGREK